MNTTFVRFWEQKKTSFLLRKRLLRQQTADFSRVKLASFTAFPGQTVDSLSYLVCEYTHIESPPCRWAEIPDIINIQLCCTRLYPGKYSQVDYRANDFLMHLLSQLTDYGAFLISCFFLFADIYIHLYIFIDSSFN